MTVLHTQNCNICDEPVLLILGEYYEIRDLSIKKSPKHIMATLFPHSCKEVAIMIGDLISSNGPD